MNIISKYITHSHKEYIFQTGNWCTAQIKLLENVCKAHKENINARCLLYTASDKQNIK